MIISSHYLSVWFRSDVVRRNQMQCTPRVMTDWNESRVRWKWSVSFSCYVIVLEVSSQWRYLYHGFSENTLSIGFWLFEVIDMKRFGIFNYAIKWELQNKGFAFGVAEKVWEFDHTFIGIYQSMGDETAKNETKRWNEDAWGEFDQKNLKFAHHLAILFVCWFFRCNWVSCWDSCLSYLHQKKITSRIPPLCDVRWSDVERSLTYVEGQFPRVSPRSCAQLIRAHFLQINLSCISLFVIKAFLDQFIELNRLIAICQNFNF